MRPIQRITLVTALLAFTATHAATILDGAEIYSKSTVKYGRWEIRMQVAATPGSVSSFFTYYNNSYLGLPEPWREIDIEVLGKNGSGFQSNILTGDAADKTSSEVFHNSSTDLSKSYHTYELDWTPDSVVWRLDGVVQRKTVKDAQVTDLQDQLETFRMNLWASNQTAWVGKLDTTKLPIVQTVNWMSYSTYTPGAGPNGGNFTPSWTDDFTTWNSARWAKGDWTFDTNLADFTATNAIVRNGYLMLILSKKSETPVVTPPVDPLGATKPTGVTRIESGAKPFEAYSKAGRLVVSGIAIDSPVTIATAAGRILVSSVLRGEGAFTGLPQGVLVVRVGEESRRIVMD